MNNLLTSLGLIVINISAVFSIHFWEDHKSYEKGIPSNFGTLQSWILTQRKFQIIGFQTKELKFENKTFYASNQLGSVRENYEYCTKHDKVMISIHSKKENDFVSAIYGNGFPIWLGGLRDKTLCKYRWLDGRDMDYENWRNYPPHFEPSFDGCTYDKYTCCAVEMDAKGYWNDVCPESENKNAIICENEPEE